MYQWSNDPSCNFNISLPEAADSSPWSRAQNCFGQCLNSPSPWAWCHDYTCIRQGGCGKDAHARTYHLAGHHAHFNLTTPPCIILNYIIMILNGVILENSHPRTASFRVYLITLSFHSFNMKMMPQATTNPYMNTDTKQNDCIHTYTHQTNNYHNKNIELVIPS